LLILLIAAILIISTIYIFSTWQFRYITGYNWDFSISLYEFLIGISAFISALAIIASGIIWIVNKLNKNTTIIKSCQPYISIGENNIFPINSQYEFTQILREAPLELLQCSSLLFLVKYNSINNNESRLLYKSICKPRFGLSWIIKTENERLDDTFSVRLKRIKSYLFEKKQYEDFIHKYKDKNNDYIQKLYCEVILDPILFIPYNKTITIIVKIKNADNSCTPWYKCNLLIEDSALKSIYEKLNVQISDNDINDWLNKWRENLKKNNEKKFDFYS
jgi:hypothetical protein